MRIENEAEEEQHLEQPFAIANAAAIAQLAAETGRLDLNLSDRAEVAPPQFTGPRFDLEMKAELTTPVEEPALAQQFPRLDATVESTARETDQALETAVDSGPFRLRDIQNGRFGHGRYTTLAAAA